MRLLRHVEGVMGGLHREAAVEQRPEDGVDVGQGGRAGRATFLEDARRPGMAEHHVAGGHDLPAEVGLPVAARRGSLELADDAFDDAVEQVVLVADVAVERHGVDAEVLAEPAHAQRLEAAPVGEVDGGLQDALAGQRRAAFGVRALLSCHVDKYTA